MFELWYHKTEFTKIITKYESFMIYSLKFIFMMKVSDTQMYVITKNKRNNSQL